MIIIQSEIYICEFCRRKMFGKGAMSLHEKQCKHNPKNKHKCFEFCRYLIKGFDKEKSETTFFCSKQNDLSLYSYKLERFSCHKTRIKYLSRMPLECNFYERNYAASNNLAFDNFQFD